MKLPQDWNKKTIGELKFEIGDGNYSSLYPKSNEFTDAGILFFTANSLQKNKLTINGARFISEKKHSTLKKGQLKKGDVLLSTRGDIGKTALVPDEFIGQNINAQLVRLNPLGKMDSAYLWQYLSTPWVKSRIESFQTGSALKQLPIGSLKKIEISYPSVEEQKKIAQILSTWDEAIEAVDELIEKNEKKLKALLHYYFGNVDKDSKTKIGSICTVRRGASPRPIKDPKWFGGDTGWVRISDVTSSKKYLRHTQDYLSDEGVNKSVFIDKGEVVLSICATIGRPIIVDMKACIHDGFVWFDGLPDNLDREFFYYQLSFMEEKYKSLRQHGSQGNLNTSIVSNTRLYLPDPKIQKEIAKNLSLLDEQLDLLNKKKHLLEKQKKGLMQRLLTGKVRVN